VDTIIEKQTTREQSSTSRTTLIDEKPQRMKMKYQEVNWNKTEIHTDRCWIKKKKKKNY